MERDDDVVVFGKYGDAVMANIVKGVLETNGVMARVVGDTMASVLSAYPLDMATSKVVVLRRDLERAKQIMASKPIGQEHGEAEKQ